MRHVVLCLLIAVLSNPVFASQETDSITQECRRLAKRHGIKVRAKIEVKIAAVRAADRFDRADDLDKALSNLAKACGELRLESASR